MVDKVHIKNLNKSCTSNSYVAGSFEYFFLQNGFSVVDSEEEADVIILNGCNVVDNNSKLNQEYSALAKALPNKKILSVGCTPSLNRPGDIPKNFYFLPYRRILAKPSEITDIIKAQIPFQFAPADYMMPDNKKEFWQALGLDMEGMCYIRIADGCQDKCAFCEIKSAKGSLASVPLKNIMDEFVSGLNKGKRKFWLFADDVSVWGRDRGLDIADLCAALLKREPSARLHFFEGTPSYIVDILDRIEPYLQSIDFLMIPFQSGSNKILASMNRRYTIEPILEGVRRMKNINPNIFLKTTAIVGFPGETRDDLRKTLVAATYFDSTIFFRYQVKLGTESAGLKGKISEEEISFRMELVRNTARRLGIFENLSAITGVDSAFGYQDQLWVRKNIGRISKD